MKLSNALLALSLSLTAAACSTTTSRTLQVSATTGFVAGPEFNSVLTEVYEGTDTSGSPVATARADAALGQKYATGYPIATFTDLPSGTYTVWVHLFKDDGSLLAERRVRFAYNEMYALRVPLTRDCATGAVACPRGGSSILTECLAGECVDPRCNPSDITSRSFCGSAQICNGDATCTGEHSVCSYNTCSGGICMQAQLADTCATGWCNPDSTGGCVVVETIDAGLADAGVAPNDAGRVDEGLEPNDAGDEEEDAAEDDDAGLVDAGSPTL